MASEKAKRVVATIKALSVWKIEHGDETHQPTDEELACIIDSAISEAINERDKVWKVAAQRKGKSVFPDMMAALVKARAEASPEIARLRELLREAREALDTALNYIPDNTVLGERDANHCERVIERINKELGEV